jgi:hypothetical protein
MVPALIGARFGSGSSKPSSKCIIKFNQRFTVGRYGRDHGFKPIACQTVAFKYFCNFLNLFVPEIVNFPVLPRLLCPIMFAVRPGRKITPKTHCNGPRDDLRETSGHDDFR